MKPLAKTEVINNQNDLENLRNDLLPMPDFHLETSKKSPKNTWATE